MITDEQIDAIMPANVRRSAELHQHRWRQFAREVLALQPSASAEPVAWRIRYRSEPGMIGHYPWSYTERKPKTPRPEHEVEPVYASPVTAAREQEAACSVIADCSTPTLCLSVGTCKGVHVMPASVRASATGAEPARSLVLRAVVNMLEKFPDEIVSKELFDALEAARHDLESTAAVEGGALKPCPFCGSAAAVSFGSDGEVCNVRCLHWGKGCMGAGRNCYSEKEARTAWNQRATPTTSTTGKVDASRVRDEALSGLEVSEEFDALSQRLNWNTLSAVNAAWQLRDQVLRAEARDRHS
jgi:hypothetical protein